MGSDALPPLPPAPPPSSAATRATMRANRRRDTGPERALRSELHRRGLRYRVDLRIDLDGGARVRPDVAFTRAKVAVFVDGCFWHGCPDHCRAPKTHAEWWAAKIDRNRRRDRRTDRVLAEAGWRVIRVWEHENPVEAAAAVAREVGRRPP